MQSNFLWFRDLPPGGAQIETLSVPIAALPSALIGARILFVTDIHLGPFFSLDAVDRLIDQIIGIEPDMILWGGDFAESAALCEAFFLRAARLKPRLGMAAIVGNNDRESFPASLDPLRRMAERAGIRLLVNERWTIPFSDGTLAIIGIDEGKYGYPDASVLAHVPNHPEAMIFLSHSPVILDELFAAAPILPSLTLCGHTHGGQINLRGFSVYDLGYEGARPGKQRFYTTKGVKQVDGVTIWVSAGIGSSKFPIRVNCPPEINLITLAPKDGAESGTR